jgi:hypothetical protein
MIARLHFAGTWAVTLNSGPLALRLQSCLGVSFPALWFRWTCCNSHFSKHFVSELSLSTNQRFQIP